MRLAMAKNCCINTEVSLKLQFFQSYLKINPQPLFLKRRKLEKRPAQLRMLVRRRRRCPVSSGDPIVHTPQPWTKKKTAMERIKVSAAFIIVFISIDLSRRSFLWLPT
jgi:hypothetical protein